MATRSKYSKIFTGYLSNYDLDCQVNFENMLDHLIKECKIKGETVKKHLHEFFLGNPNHLEKVKYYMPKS